SVRVGIVLCEGQRRLGRIETRALESAGAQRKFGVVDAAAEAHAGFARAVAADSCSSAASRSAARENLDHAADRVRPVDARQGPRQDFDALNLVEWNVLKCGATGGSRADALSVDQHHGVARLGTPHRHRAWLAEAPAVRNFDATTRLQELEKR